MRLIRLHALVGQVVGGANRSQAGAEVWVHGGPWQPRRANADREGRFKLELPAGTYEVYAVGRAPARASPMINVDVGLGVPKGTKDTAGKPAARRGVELVLGPASVLSGRVVGEGGKPLAGARVVVFPRKGASAIRFVANSGVDGRFAIGPLPAGDWSYEAWFPGLLPELERSAKLPAREPLTIKLSRGRTVAGVVLEPGGQRPVGGALVRAVLTGGASARPLEGAGELGVVPGPIPRIPRPGEPVSAVAARVGIWSAVSDASGAFKLAGLPSRPLRLLAEHPRFGPAEATWGGETSAPARLVLTPAFAITGLVRTSAGVPVVGVEVKGQGEGGAERRATSDRDGRYRLEGLAGAEVALSAAKEGYLPVAIAVGLDTHLVTRDLVLEVARGELRGLVLDEREGPLAGATVVARGPGGLRLTGRSGSDGRFVLRGIAGRAGITLRVSLAGHVTVERALAAGEGSYLHVRLAQLSSLTGRVQDARIGTVISEFSLGLDGAAPKVVRDARGAFRLAAPTGRRRLKISAPGYATQELAVDVPPASRLSVPLAIELTAAGTISGSVSDTNGRPLAGLRVTVAASAGALSVGARTDARGAFILRGVAEGARTLRVQRQVDAPPLLVQPVTVQAKQTTGPLRLLVSP